MTDEQMPDSGGVNSLKTGGGEPEAVQKLLSQIASGGSWASLGRIFGKAATLGLNILLGNVLGPGRYGLYALANSVFVLINKLSIVGLNKGAVRYGAIRSDSEEKFVELLYATLLLALGSSVAFSVGLYLNAGLLADTVFGKMSLAPLLEVFAALIPFIVILRIIGALFQARRRVDYQQFVYNIVKPVLNLVFVGVAFLLGFELWGALVGILLAGVMSTLFGGYLLIRTFPGARKPICPSIATVRELLTFSLPMTLVSLSYFLTVQTDRLMLGVFAPASEVGIYNVAAILAIQLGIVHGSLITIFSPIISETVEKGEHDQLYLLYNTVKRWSIFGSVVLVLPLLFFPRFVMSLFGVGFQRGWLLLPLLSIGQLVGAAFGPTGALLQMSGHERIEVANSISLALLNLFLNAALIPIFGALGAVAATTVSLLSINFVQVYQVHRFMDIQPITPRHLLFLAGVGIIFVGGFVSNYYLETFVRTIMFTAVVVTVLLVGYLGRTGRDKQAFEDLIAKEIKWGDK